MTSNPFAVLGLPEWPDLDDETVDAAWRAIAAATLPGRDDGGDLARYAQACAAYHELHSRWGRSEAYTDLLQQARADGRHRADPDPFYPGTWPGQDGLPPGPVPVVELGPVPLAEVARLVAGIPARVRRGHPLRLLLRAAVIAGLCLTLLTVFPGSSMAGFAVLVLALWFVVSARQDLAPLSRPVRRKERAGKSAAAGKELCLRRGLGLQDGRGPRTAFQP